MAPRSKLQQQSAAPESTASRRSARLAGSAPPPSDAADGKKRSASAPKSGPASKKAKTSSTSKSSRPTKSKPTQERIDEEPEATDDAAKKEVAKAVANGANGANRTKAETNGNANGTTTAASEAEKKEEAPAEASPEAPSGGILKLGDTLPSLKLQNEQGKDVELSSLADKKGVVLFLYPKADTPGCTNQACGYRDAYDEIKELGYDIYGLSKDKPAAQLKWKTKKELNYSLLSDPESKFIKKLGAFVQPNNTKRSHFIFEKGSGKLIDIALGVKPANDPSNCVAFLKKHHK